MTNSPGSAPPAAESSRHPLWRLPGRMALLFAFAGCTWVISSDLLVHYIEDSSAGLPWAEMIKEIAFVLTSAGLSYAVLTRALHHAEQYEGELAEQRDLLQAVVDNTSAALALVDRAARILTCNEAMATLTGVPADELLGRDVREFLDPGEDEALIAQFRDFLSGADVPPEAVTRIRHRSGAWREVELRCTAHRRRGHVTGFVVEYRDVTEQRAAARRLVAIERLSREVVEHSQNGIVLVDRRGKMVLYNPAVARMFGYSYEEFGMLSVRALFLPEQSDALVRERNDFIDTGTETQLMTLELRGREGHPLHMQLALTPLDDSEHGARVLAEFRDLTQEAEIERQLAESEERLRLIIENSQSGIVVLDGRGRAVLFNSTLAAVLGYAAEEMMDARFDQFLAESERSVLTHYLREWIVAGITPEHWRLTRLQRRDGVVIEAALAVTSFTEREDERRLLIEVRDVTEARNFERRLEESEQRFRTMVENAQNGFMLLDDTGQPASVNPALERMLGFSEVELADLALETLVEPADLPQLVWTLTGDAQTAPAAPITAPIRLRRKDHSPLDVQLTYTAFHTDSEQRGALLELRDVTRELALQRQLTERIAELTSLFETAPLPLLIFDTHGFIVRSNKAVQDVFGWTPEALQGQPLEVLIAREDRALRRAAFFDYALADTSPTAAERVPITDVATGLRRDGGTVPIEFTVSEYPTLDGGRRFTIAIMDLTERRRAEHARQAERVAEARAAFLRTMSHELRTPLNSVLGFAQVLDHELSGPLNELQHEQVRDILDAGRHLLSLINDVLDLSRIDAGRWVLNLTAFNPMEIVFEVVGQLKPLADARGLKLRLEAGDAPASFMADARAVRQILTNLAGNAIKYTSSGWVEIRIEDAEGGLLLAVQDTGPGIPAEQLEHLFDEFFQLDSGQRAGSGSGLGLAIAQRLAALHGGRIDVSSEAGQGSTFTVFLPAGLQPDPAPGSQDGNTVGNQR